jgi:uncharacterized protein YeaO (DUF488 family)
MSHLGPRNEALPDGVRPPAHGTLETTGRIGHDLATVEPENNWNVAQRVLRGIIPNHVEKTFIIRVKRVYDLAAKSEGTRFLVERLWPRGMKKADLKMDGWLKEAAPSGALRRCFNHELEKWLEFQRCDFVEFDSRPETWQPLLLEARRSDVTLLFGAREQEHDNSIALKTYLETQIARHSREKRDALGVSK